MPRLYILIPCALLLLFGGFYWNYAANARAEAAAIAAEQTKITETKAAEQAAAELAARDAAEQRAVERAAAETRTEAERREKWQAEQTRLADEVARLKTEVATLDAKVSAAEKTLAQLQSDHDTLRKANLAAGLATERLRITKTTAELELQRLIAMLARRLGQDASLPAL